jgi:hypothetical protein
MADKSDLVINHLGELFKHRELIAAAYHTGSVDAGDDPDGGRGLFKLNQARILVPYREGTYRLASSLSKHLDEVLQIERLYSAAGANVSELAQRLPDIANLVADAAFDGRTDDADRYIDEFDRAVFELADAVTGALQSLRIQADNKFANVSSYAEKRRQNEFYLDRVERISQALGAIQSGDMIRSLESTPEGERLLESYRSQIANHLAEWRSQLLDITAILREYLFRTRQIELIARRMRSFELFLKRTPSYVPADIEAASDTTGWAKRAAGFSLVAHACVHDTAQDEILLEIARSIPAVKPPGVAPSRVGTLLPNAPIEPDEREAEMQPWEEAVVAMLDSVGATPISALAWKASRSEISALDNDIWLLCLLHEEAKDLKRNAGVRFEQVTEPVERLSGMIPVTDIRISRATP